MKTTYANGDVYSAGDVNDTNGTINLLGSSVAYTAGKNILLNAAAQIWQRGTSIVGTTTAFCADRWQAYRGVAGSTFSRQATSDTTNLPFIQYCIRAQRDNGNTSTSVLYLAQTLESVNSIPFAGKSVTLSFYARRGANYSAASNLLTVDLRSGTGTDQNIFTGFTGNTAVISTTATLTTTWQRFTFTGTVASTATQLGFYVGFTPVGTAGAADFFEITGFQLEQGSTATAFQTATGTIQGELANCQRYYYRATATQNYTILSAYGNTVSATLGNITMPIPVTMRVTPTSADFANIATFDGAVRAISAVTILYASPTTAHFETTVASGQVQYRPLAIISNNNAAGYIGFSAEL
jgi:hypothetical protein